MLLLRSLHFSRFLLSQINHQLLCLLLLSVALLKLCSLLLDFLLELVALLPKTSLPLFLVHSFLFELITHLLHLMILLLKSLLIVGLLLGHVLFELVQLLFKLTLHIRHGLQLILLSILRCRRLNLLLLHIVVNSMRRLQRLSSWTINRLGLR